MITSKVEKMGLEAWIIISASAFVVAASGVHFVLLCASIYDLYSILNFCMPYLLSCKYHYSQNSALKLQQQKLLTRLSFGRKIKVTIYSRSYCHISIAKHDVA